MGEHDVFVILTGTDPDSKKGGIGFALPGYFAALQAGGIFYVSIPTYNPATNSGKWWLCLSSLPKIITQVYKQKKKGFTVVVYSHAGRGVSLLRETMVLFVSRLSGAKTILQLHSIEVDAYLENRLIWWLFKWVIASFDRVCVLTPWWKERFKKVGVKENISVIPNPLPFDWEKRANAGYKSIGNNIGLQLLVMTRLESGKGVGLVIEAMQFLSDSFHLVIAGDGKQLKRLKVRAQCLGITNKVTFTGWVGGEQKQKIIENADVFCLPTTYDSFGMGFLEAMANGLPVIAIDWGPIRDVVLQNKTGLLIKQADAQLLSSAIKKMIDTDLRKQLGREGQRWVLENFSAQKIGEKLQDIMCLLTDD